VWEDEADAALSVPVAGTSRLRKLRHAEEEETLEGAAYVERLREQHARIHPHTAWAALPAPGVAAAGGDADDDEEEGADGGRAALLTSAVALSRPSAAGGDALGLPLPAGELQALRVRDANAAEPAGAVVRSCAFHPTAPLLLAAGLDKTLRLFGVDGTRNPKLQGVHFEDMPIHRAAFASDGASVVATGRRRHFYVYHLEAGRVERVAGIVGCADRSLESFVASPPGTTPLLAFLADGGRVPLVALGSRSCVGTLKMNGSARAAAFAADGRTLLTAGGDGHVYVWDLRTQRCLDKLVDEGALSVAALAAAPGGRHYATGGDMGVVNLYARATHTRVLDAGGAAAGAVAAPRAPVRPKPLKSVMNLTTLADTLAFSPDGQMLAMASRMERDALRIMHVPSRTVFANWPSSKTPLHYVHSLAFSPHCGYLAVGNARGKVLLYRLTHYDRL
jgi:U3 small nucleolar RNA-associated protein 18